MCEDALLSIGTAALVGPVAAELASGRACSAKSKTGRPSHCCLRSERKRQRLKRQRRLCAPCRVYPDCQPHHRPLETEACHGGGGRGHAWRVGTLALALLTCAFLAGGRAAAAAAAAAAAHDLNAVAWSRRGGGWSGGFLARSSASPCAKRHCSPTAQQPLLAQSQQSLSPLGTRRCGLCTAASAPNGSASDRSSGEGTARHAVSTLTVSRTIAPSRLRLAWTAAAGHSGATAAAEDTLGASARVRSTSSRVRRSARSRSRFSRACSSLAGALWPPRPPGPPFSTRATCFATGLAFWWLYSDTKVTCAPMVSVPPSSRLATWTKWSLSPSTAMKPKPLSASKETTEPPTLPPAAAI
eukprot:scaffold49019_cov63-Phaeocystis_antarctica.AAC.5